MTASSENKSHNSSNEPQKTPINAGTKGLQVRLREVRDSCTRTERGIVDFIRTHPEQVVSMTVRELATQTYSSTSSVMRVCKAVGLKGYRELRIALLLEIADASRGSRHKEGTLTKNDTIDEIVSKVITNSIKSFEDTEKLIDVQEIEKVAHLINSAGRVLLFGMGSSSLVAEDLLLKLLRLDKTCLHHADAHSQLLMAHNSRPDDLAILFSYSGRTVEMIDCLHALKSNKTTAVAITRLGGSPISAEADICLNVAANESLFRSGAMSSRLTQLAVVDVIYTTFASINFERSTEMLKKTYIHKD